MKSHKFLLPILLVTNFKGHLHEEPPLMSDEKQKALEIFLTSRQRNDNKEFIQKKLAEKSLKCKFLCNIFI